MNQAFHKGSGLGLFSNPSITNVALTSTIAGAASGAVVSIGSCPFELVKVRRQLEYQIARDRMERAEKLRALSLGQKFDPLTHTGKDFMAGYKPPGTWTAVKDIYREKGFTGLWAGFKLHSGPMPDWAKGWLPVSLIPFSAGAVAGVTSWALIYPVDFRKLPLTPFDYFTDTDAAACLIRPERQAIPYATIKTRERTRRSESSTFIDWNSQTISRFGYIDDALRFDARFAFFETAKAVLHLPVLTSDSSSDPLPNPGSQGNVNMSKAYPLIDPYSTGYLKVSDVHTLYYEECGNPNGKPVVFLHGGPGGGISLTDRGFFDPEFYRIVLFDQRGSGKSTPSADLREKFVFGIVLHTTWDVVEDIEKLRKELNIAKWLVFGGSWGSCLALAYSQKHTEQVVGMVLRGIFTLRKTELDFFYQNGASHIHPEAFEEYLAPVPESERDDMVKAYHKLLNSDDDDVRVNAAKAWSKWEMATSKLIVDPLDVAKAAEDTWANAFARIENHYFVNEGWMEQGQLLKAENVNKIKHLPCIIVQGRYDIVCPFKTAWDLHKQWPESNLKVVPNAGHSSREIATLALLVEATDEFRGLSWE
ncbi:hypothetical protein QFC22_000436 [Naganishia vaughanmartiniae]|uniref:Uncharacterized protein n=1 Tax=Naganishia vaughanmartiniae TaxID=1424756 RepID=A0ACC2XQ48_9TREE|nr:hypothetical protein QFC22_000436 [Naganishia vaughanmartiniae]